MNYLELLKKKYALIMRSLGTMLLGVGFIILSPLPVLLVFREEAYLAPCFILPAVLSFSLGFALRYLYKARSDVILDLKDASLIVVVIWVVTMLISALPFILWGQLNFTQALFESVSGWTTTGLSVVDVEKAPRLILLWRSIMQLFGGAGLAVIMLTSIIGPYSLGIYNAEGRSDRLLPHVLKTVKMIMVIYGSYVSAGILLYILAGMPWFDALNHSFAALSTGGFSTRSASIGAYNSLAIELITIILMLLGTTNFAAHYLLLRGELFRFYRLGEIRFMFFLISFFIPIVIFFSLFKLYGSLGRSIRVGFFEFISAITTTGFSTVGYSDWSSFVIFIMICLMLIGGGTGSTAGGIKQYRAYLVLKSLLWNIKKFFLPRYIVEENYVYRPEGKSFVTRDHIIETSSFILLYLLTYVVGVAVLVYHGYSLQDSLFEFASSLGTVGLSVGVTAAGSPPVVLWTEIFSMILGRLEFFVIIFAVIKGVMDLRLLLKRHLGKTLG